MSQNHDVRVYALATGELIPGGGEEIAVGCLSWETGTYLEKIRIFQYNGSTYEEVWQQDMDYLVEDVYHIKIADLNGDGQNELFVSTTFGLRVYGNHNVGVAAILAPSRVIPLNSTITPKALVRNYGQYEETFPIVFRIGSSYEDIKTVTLSPFGSDTVTFTPWYTNQIGQFAVTCSTMLSGDEYPRNDVKKDSIFVEQNMWICIDTTGPVRFWPGYAYDETRNKVIIFGGRDSWSLAGRHFRDETFEWDGSRWTQVCSIGPSPRHYPMVIYDEARQKTVLFGGWYPDRYYDDTWIWDGDSWIRLYPPVSPGGRSQVAKAYDRQRQRVVIFGGCYYQTFYDETWEWDGSSWIYRGSGGPPACAWASMAYDERRGVCVLFGGQTQYGQRGRALRETWEWDGNTWTLVDTGGPAARSDAKMVYDPTRGAVILFGGRDECSQPYTVYYNDTWEWDGTTWRRIGTMGPPGWGSQFIVFHGGLNKILMFNLGDSTSTLSGNLWVYRGFDHDVTVSQIIAPFGTILKDTVITPMAEVKNVGQESETFPVHFKIGDLYFETMSISLGAGETDTIEFPSWTATQLGDLVVSCSTALTGDENPSNDKKISSIRVTDIAKAELRVNAWSQSRVSPGERINFIIEYRNTGPVAANDAILSLSLDTAFEYLSASAGAYYDSVYHCVSWNPGALHPNYTGYLSVCSKVKFGLPGGTILDNYAYIEDVELPGFSSLATVNLALNGINNSIPKNWKDWNKFASLVNAAQIPNLYASGSWRQDCKDVEKITPGGLGYYEANENNGLKYFEEMGHISCDNVFAFSGGDENSINRNFERLSDMQ